MRNRGTQRTSPLWDSRAEDSLGHRSLCNPRGLVRGAYDTLSALGHVLLQTSLDGPGLRRAKGASPPRAPEGSP